MSYFWAKNWTIFNEFAIYAQPLLAVLPKTSYLFLSPFPVGKGLVPTTLLFAKLPHMDWHMLELKYLLFMVVWDPFQMDYPFVSGLHKSTHL